MHCCFLRYFLIKNFYVFAEIKDISQINASQFALIKTALLYCLQFNQSDSLLKKQQQQKRKPKKGK